MGLSERARLTVGLMAAAAAPCCEAQRGLCKVRALWVLTMGMLTLGVLLAPGVGIAAPAGSPSPGASPSRKTRVAPSPEAPVRPSLAVAKETVVFLAPRSDAAQARAVAGVIAAQLEGMGVRFRLLWVSRLAPSPAGQLAVARRLARVHRALVVVWCDFTNGVRLQLFYAHADRSRVLVRTVDRAASAQGRAETMGAIVRGGVEAMLSLRRAGPGSRRPRARPLPSRGRRLTGKSLPSRRLSSVGAEMELAYALIGYSSQEPPLVHGVRLGVRLLLATGWTMHLAYRIAPGIRSQSEDGLASLLMVRHGLLLGGGRSFGWGRLRLGLEAAFLLDLLDRRHRASGGLSPEPAALDVNLGLAAHLRLGLMVTPWLELFGAVGATAMVRSRSYFVEGAQEPFLKPWIVQPQLTMGVTLRIY